MADTIAYSGQLVVVTCWCGMRHAVPAELRHYQERQHDDGREQRDIYCPLGHTHVIAGKGRAAELEEALGRERSESARLAAERDQAEASARAHKGAATKARKRAAAGVCPCCHRTVKQLAEHMKTKHPDFAPEASDAA
jgi:hypothetical protein